MNHQGHARLFVCVALLTAASATGAHDGRRDAAGPAGGGTPAYAFPLAEPGSYALPAIGVAAGGRVLDEQARERDLSELLHGRIAILAFIYTRCGDVCPTASLRLSELQDLAAGRPETAGLRLVSMSFDPEHDTPDVMAEYASHWRSADPGAPEWLYVTAAGRGDLEPILKAYDQSVMPKEAPSPAGDLYHILRVFLVDRSGTIRNIYSLDFLDPALVLNDIRSLALEPARDERPSAGTERDPAARP